MFPVKRLSPFSFLVLLATLCASTSAFVTCTNETDCPHDPESCLAPVCHNGHCFNVLDPAVDDHDDTTADACTDGRVITHTAQEWPCVVKEYLDGEYVISWSVCSTGFACNPNGGGPGVPSCSKIMRDMFCSDGCLPNNTCPSGVENVFYCGEDDVLCVQEYVPLQEIGPFSDPPPPLSSSSSAQSSSSSSSVASIGTPVRNNPFYVFYMGCVWLENIHMPWDVWWEVCNNVINDTESCLYGGGFTWYWNGTTGSCSSISVPCRDNRWNTMDLCNVTDPANVRCVHPVTSSCPQPPNHCFTGVCMLGIYGHVGDAPPIMLYNITPNPNGCETENESGEIAAFVVFGISMAILLGFVVYAAMDRRRRRRGD